MTQSAILAAPTDMTEMIKPEHVIGALCVTDKAQLFSEFGVRAGSALGIGAPLIVDLLLARECLGSTAVGQGCAVPHTPVPGLTRYFGLFARLEPSIDFSAPDSHPVDLAFLLLSPEAPGNAPLAALAGICRRLRNPKVADAMRATRDPARIYALLTGGHVQARDL